MIARPLTRASRISRTFIWEGWVGAWSYPSALVVSEIAMLIPIITYRFVAPLVHSPHLAGVDYYTFVVLGFVTWRLLSGAVSVVASDLQAAVDQGRFEMLLVQPVSWRLLPFALAQWPVTLRLANTAVGLAVAVALGARFRLQGLPLTVVILALGVGATLAAAALIASVTLIAKKSDSVLRLYALAAGLLAGVFYPIAVLPAWVRVFSYAVPDTYVIAAVRQTALPGGTALPGPSATTAIAALIVLNLVLLPVSAWAFGRALDFGRKTGTLGRY